MPVVAVVVFLLFLLEAAGVYFRSPWLAAAAGIAMTVFIACVLWVEESRKS